MDAAATKGPWGVVIDYADGKDEAWGYWHRFGPFSICVGERKAIPADMAADVALTVTLRNALPALAALLDAAEALRGWCKDADANDSFERIGDAYYRASGFLRPGKDDVFRDSSSDENVARFHAWADAEYGKARDAYDTARTALAAALEGEARR